MKLTRKQIEALFAKWRQHSQGVSYLQFRRSVLPIMFGNGAVTVQWCGMWLAIETDGYVHS